MLKISNYKINRSKLNYQPKSLSKVESRVSNRVGVRLIGFFSIVLIIAMFLPWTQNIRSNGFVNTLRPEQRPQTIHSVIDGRIEAWHVKEGDYVDKGDTIIFISEIKDQYFDPQLLERTQDQLKAKELTVLAYAEKVEALENQLIALKETARLKRKQAENKLLQAKLKVQSDSIDFEAAIINATIAKNQLERTENLYNEGLKSKTDLEDKNKSYQKMIAAKISYENKLLASKNQVINAEIELISIDAQYENSIAKTQSDKFSAESTKLNAELEVTKIKNQYTNYLVRSGMYYITAPQDGYITKAIRFGIGETIKAGEPLVSIVPSDFQLAVEMYVKPIDLPLIKLNQEVRIQFDGWPAIVFSGWPNTSFGTFGGKVFAIDNYISDNGLYRVIVKPDPSKENWPDPLRTGAGANSILLLKDVPVWYELWRQFNGFPPNYYAEGTQYKTKKEDDKKKK